MRRVEHVSDFEKPTPSDGGNLMGAKYVPRKDLVKEPIKLESAVRLYGNKRNDSVIAGSHISVRTKSFYTEMVGEFDTNAAKITKSDIGFSWLLDQTQQPGDTRNTSGNLEVSLAMRNVTALFDSSPIERTPSANGLSEEDPKLSISFYKHSVVPRKVLVAVDSRYALISNYVDIGFEATMNPKQFLEEGNNNSQFPLEMSLGASWQINKNNLLKFRVNPQGIS